MSKVLIPLTDGFEDIEALAVNDVLRRGGLKVNRCPSARRGRGRDRVVYAWSGSCERAWYCDESR